ncbi:MAG: O-antigen ligase family protein [Isosphaeraceae bacterium]
MKGLWVFLLPMVFLPSFGLGSPTALGVLELSDYLIIPVIALMWWSGRRSARRLAGAVWLPLVFFIGWSLVSTLLIRERFGYGSDHQTLMSCSKLGKFTLYAIAGLLASRALDDPREAQRFGWVLLVVGLVVAASLTWFSGQGEGLHTGQALEGYKTNNGISVLMAMLLCYFGGLWLTGRGTPRWRALAPPAMGVMIVGFLVSQGRGGWVAGFAGAGYLLYRCRLRSRVVVGLAAAAIAVGVAYEVLPPFRLAVDRTIDPDPYYLRDSVQVIPGVDDGDRIYMWELESVKFLASPILGTGFFHRGGASGLFSAGSHNFFLQMALETGAAGFAAIAAIFATMWRQAGSAAARAEGQDVPVRAALVAAIVGGLSGEYFYGGTPLLGLMLIYSQVGRLPAPARIEASPPRHDDALPAFYPGTPGSSGLSTASCPAYVGVLSSGYADSYLESS